MTLCACCFITALPAAVSASESPVAVCAACAPHYGNLAKTAAAHGAMMANVREQHAKVLERMDAQLTAMTEARDSAQSAAEELTATVTSEYVKRPGGAVQQLIESSVVDDLTRDAARARRARDLTKRAIGRIHELHHQAGDRCSCGKALRDCQEYQALDAIREPYLQWAKRQGS